MNKYWLYLLGAGAVEILWLICIKYSDGFSRPWPTAGLIALGLLSVFLAAQAMQGIASGTVYAVWTGTGAVGGAIVGIWLFKEPSNAVRLISIGLIVLGIIGLKLSAPSE